MHNIYNEFLKWLQRSYNKFILFLFLDLSWWMFRKSLMLIINNKSVMFAFDQIFIFFLFGIFIYLGAKFVRDRAALLIFPLQGFPAVILGLFLIIGFVIISFFYTKALIVRIVN